MEENEILVSEQVLQVPFVYSAGPVASRFLIGLRDEKKIYGLKCDKCGKVHVPPRAVCGTCGGPMQTWLEVGPTGTLENFTTIHYPETTHPLPAPFTLGLVRLDGADTCLTHVILGPPESIRIGMRVKPVFRDQRRGHVLDLSGFAPET